MKIVMASSIKLRNLVKKRGHDFTNSIVYEIPSSGCGSSYFEESGCALPTGLNDRLVNVRLYRTNSVLDEADHLPRWKDARNNTHNTKTQQQH